jgi:fructokinase
MGMILGIGELLWDMLPSGPRLGGAPANFASHASALGADAAVISRVGADEEGRKLLTALQELGVSIEGVTMDPDHTTGTVEVSLGTDGQPEFTIHENVAWDHLCANPALLAMASSADAVCFGSLGQRNPASRDAIRELVAATPANALRVFDANLRQRFFTREILMDSLALANVFKLSDSELPVIAEILDIGGDVRQQLEEFLTIHQLKAIVYTRGARGSILTDGEIWCDHPGIVTDVKDTIGAGDSFTCAVTMGMLAGWPLEWISETATEIAAYVCSQHGAVPQLPDHLRQRFLSGKTRF